MKQLVNRVINAVGGSGAQGERRNFGGLGPASFEASESQGAVPLPPRSE
jgi:hypothetical protein